MLNKIKNKIKNNPITRNPGASSLIAAEALLASGIVTLLTLHALNVMKIPHFSTAPRDIVSLSVMGAAILMVLPLLSLVVNLAKQRDDMKQPTSDRLNAKSESENKMTEINTTSSQSQHKLEKSTEDVQAIHTKAPNNTNENNNMSLDLSASAVEQVIQEKAAACK